MFPFQVSRNKKLADEHLIHKRNFRMPVQRGWCWNAVLTFIRFCTPFFLVPSFIKICYGRCWFFVLVSFSFQICVCVRFHNSFIIRHLFQCKLILCLLILEIWYFLHLLLLLILLIFQLVCTLLFEVYFTIRIYTRLYLTGGAFLLIRMIAITKKTVLLIRIR